MHSQLVSYDLIISSNFCMQYIKKLIFTDLDKYNVEYILRQLRKMPWAECESYILKCFLKVHKGKYNHIYVIAILTAGLSRHHDDFAVAVVDEASRMQLFMKIGNCIYSIYYYHSFLL
jgi:hypothetical protein